ncbi:glycosyltransferase family 2 protein [Flavobacterium adhaerens]|uniref:glycosyltransferase family 2 protein n=1 Tax=Flavobacterium adhaerens TaxID=3149043 RepID=UPI0032B4966E
MLSILIPVYNYNVYTLVVALKQQADELEITYEIIVQDDNSSQFISENSKINSLENCSFFSNTQNLGRGRTINLLGQKSKYDYVLIMESDAFPENNFYLKNYILLLSQTPSIVFGGVNYPENIPPKEKILRWKYGKIRETKSLNHRVNNQYDFVFTWNLLIQKQILLAFPFPEFITEYGYEDTIFLKKLRSNSVAVTHIENPLIHQNNDDSIVFIQKSEKAVRTLYQLLYSKKIDSKDVRLTSVYSLLQKLHLVDIVKVIFSKNKQKILDNLTSEKPNLYLLDFYKLGYFCSL